MYRSNTCKTNKFKMFTYIVILASLLSACQKSEKNGSLLINAASGDIPIEIFKISDDEKSFNLTGEVIGKPNSPVQLTPGTYLVMADCSHELIVVRPGELVELNLTKVKFLTPDLDFDSSTLSIQCDKFRASIFRQQITGQFELNVLEGSRNILVNMSPLNLKLTKDHMHNPLVIKLAALKVGDNSKDTSRTTTEKYFVSLLEGTVSVTKPVRLGHWFLGIPGKYDVSINGSSVRTTLFEGQSTVFQLGKLKVASPQSLDLSLISKIRGYPYVITINGTHELLPNETYHLLPGVLNISLDNSNQRTVVEIYENTLTKIPLKSVKISIDCAPWEWECLGKGEIMLYRKGENYPFMESISDIPILYLGSDIQVGIAGSRDIRVNIPAMKNNVVFATGTLILEPELIPSKAYITDLVRLAAIQHPITGKTLDISKLHPTKMRLVAGRYKIEFYQSSLGTNEERWHTRKSIVISENNITKIKIPFHVKEKNYNKLVKKLSTNLRKAPSPKNSSKIREIF